VVKIIDWGLARCPGEAGEPPPADGDAESQLVGTADWIAPEQAHDPALVDIRADVYSLGCTLFFLLTGQPPFVGNSALEKVRLHQESPPPSLLALRPDIPAELDALVQKMLAKDPTDRFSIPLLVVTPLRRFCAALTPVGALGRPSPQGSGYRPGSSPALSTPSSANLPRPGGAPGTAINLPRPGTQPSLHRPGSNGT
jgi:serine/threonine-protein kinase